MAQTPPWPRALSYEQWRKDWVNFQRARKELSWLGCLIRRRCKRYWFHPRPVNVVASTIKRSNRREEALTAPSPICLSGLNSQRLLQLTPPISPPPNRNKKTICLAHGRYLGWRVLLDYADHNTVGESRANRPRIHTNVPARTNVYSYLWRHYQ